MAGTDSALFDWMGEGAARMNGSSDFRSSSIAKFSEVGDGLVGEVVAVSESDRRKMEGSPTPVVTIRVAAGRLGGEAVEPGDWYLVYFGTAELWRSWQQLDGLNIGDTITLGYLGMRKFNGVGQRKHTFALSVDRPTAGADW